MGVRRGPLALLLLGVATSAEAQVCQSDPTQSALSQLRRLSLDLLGRAPSLEELSSVVTNRAVDPAIVRAMVRSDAAMGELQRRHRDLLWVNVDDVNLGSAAWALQKRRGTDLYFINAQARGNAYRGGAPDGCLDEPVRLGSAGEILTTPDPVRPEWHREGWVTVHPYWDPAASIKVCAFDAQEPEQARNARGIEVSCRTNVIAGCGCGPGLAWCQSGPDRTSRVITLAMAEQLLRFIDAIVRGDRPYSDLIMATDLEINGPISHYFRYQTAAAPGQVFARPEQNLPMPVIPFPERTRWERVERGARHAGVLTLPAYLLKFQSNRGRANRFYNAFVCRSFQAPPGGLPPASDVCHDQPDLTKRCGCQYCHQQLEPLAAYWGRWAEAGVAPLNEDDFPVRRTDCVGSNDALCRRFYLRAASDPREEPFVGQLLSHVFADAARLENISRGPGALAQEALRSGEFAACTVQRTWTWLMARPPVPEDAPALAELTSTLVSHDYDLRQLIEAIVTRPEYLRSGSFQ